MSVAALFTWMATITAGLILLVIWIIEYDHEFQSAARTRLPVPVISFHVLLAAERAGDVDAMAVAVLGLVMAARWIGVYRAFSDPGPSLTRTTPAPPERSFPLPVIVGHGILAITTIVLVLLTALGVGRK